MPFSTLDARFRRQIVVLHLLLLLITFRQTQVAGNLSRQEEVENLAVAGILVLCSLSVTITQQIATILKRNLRGPPWKPGGGAKPAITS